MKTTTKVERRKNELERHYAAIERLLIACDVVYDDNMMRRKAINTSSRLLRIEQITHKAATNYCNGDIDSDMWDRICEVQSSNVQQLFRGNLKGFFINGDARGYALKIKDSVMREAYKEIRLQTDWGGYGLLAPEITGN